MLEHASRAAEADYFATAPGLSFGSLHATLVHILVGELVWLARWQGGKPPDALKDARQATRLAEEEVPNFEELRSMWDVESGKQEEFSRTLTDEQVESPLSYQTQYGEPNTQPLWQLLNHGTQFRAEAAVRLTQLELSTGDLDLISWLRSRR